MTRQLNGQEEQNIRIAARLAAEEHEKVRRRSEESARAREEWNNKSFGEKLVSIVVGIALVVGALVFLGKRQEQSSSDIANEASSSVSASAVAPADDVRSSGADAYTASYAAAGPLVPRQVDISSGSTETQVSPDAISPTKVSSAELSVDRDVSFIQRSTPLYPPLSIRQRHEGTTVVDVIVNGNGKVEKVSIETSSGYHELDRAAKEAARTWLFHAAIRDGQPVTSIIRVPVKFSLNAM